MTFSYILQTRIKKKINRILGYILPISFFTPIIFLLLDEYYKALGNSTLDIIFISCIILFLLSAIIPYFLNEYENVGEIEISYDKIIITVEDSKDEYNIKDLEMVKIFFKGYPGMTSLLSVFDYTGDGNVLEFNYKRNSFKHYFKITTSFQHKNLLKIINKWHEINSNV
jgi:hypothetical protein